MNVLFVSLSAIDDINDKGIYTDLLRKFRNNGHNVSIVSSLERRKNKETEFTVQDNINILRVKIGNVTKTNILEKGISTLLIELYYMRAIKKYYSDLKFDLIIYTTPPITFLRVIKYLKKKNKATTYLLLKDIFPQNAVDLGLFSTDSILYKYFRRKEKELYEISDFIGCMSAANLKYILKKNPNLQKSKLEVNPNSVDSDNKILSNISGEQIRLRYNLPLDKYIFIYGGNLGKPQGIDFLLECVKTNEKNNNSFFLIVGSGTEYNKIKEFFDTNNPSNAMLIKRLPKEEYDLIVNACDVGLIFLDYRFTIPNFPSRLLSYMQASMPVLAATDPNTDIGFAIEKGEFGYSCISNDVEKFNDLVNKLSDKNVQKKFSENAKTYLLNNYTSKHSYDIIMNHFE